MHIALNEEMTEKLHLYSKNRAKDKSKTIRYALDLLFSLEGLDGLKDKALKSVIERKFVVPKNIPIRSFYVFLYLLSRNYPGISSKEFWNETVYISSIERTHEEVFLEIKDEYQNFVKLSS